MSRAPRNNKSVNDQQIKFTKYKWEFLRRNPKYMKEWEKLQELLEDKYGDRRPGEQFTPEEIRFTIKWKMPPMSPKVSFHTLTSENIPLDMQAFMHFFFHLLHEKPIEIMDGWLYEPNGYRTVSDTVVESGKLTVKIDLNYSQNRLMDELQMTVTEWKKNYSKALGKHLFRKLCKERKVDPYRPDQETKEEFEKFIKQELHSRSKGQKKKYQFEIFDQYLQVYDLRKKKMSWTSITFKLGLPSIQTARNYWNAAQRLINSGIDYYEK